LYHQLKGIVPRALLLEDACDGGKKSSDLNAELLEAFAVLLDVLWPISYA
jgi:hypothetical protein